MIKPAEFIHPEDAAALRQLENIPGFPAIAKKVLELGYEKLQALTLEVSSAPTVAHQYQNKLSSVQSVVGNYERKEDFNTLSPPNALLRRLLCM